MWFKFFALKRSIVQSPVIADVGWKERTRMELIQHLI